MLGEDMVAQSPRLRPVTVGISSHKKHNYHCEYLEVVITLLKSSPITGDCENKIL